MMNYRTFNVLATVRSTRRKDNETLFAKSFLAPSVEFRRVMSSPRKPSGSEILIDLDLAARAPADARLLVRQAVERASGRAVGELSIKSIEVHSVTP
jgi:hypothetical protein